MSTAPAPGTTDKPGAPPPRELTNLQYAVGTRGFMKDIEDLLGTRAAALAFRVEVLNQALMTPRLHDCTVESSQFQLIRVARLGLSLALDEVSLIPRSNKGTVEMHADPTHAGLRKLLMRSPEVRDCFTREVREHDEFRMPLDPISLPLHQIPEKFAPRGPVIGYYAAIQMRSGHWRFWPMSVAEIEEHADQYAKDVRGNFGPAWQGGKRPKTERAGLVPFDKMALKTVLTMAANSRDVPQSADAQEGFAMQREANPPPPTAAELQGYTRQGTRAALTTGSGTTLESLRQDLGGAQDREDVEAAYARATRVTTPAPDALTLEPSAWSRNEEPVPSQESPEKGVSASQAQTSRSDPSIGTSETPDATNAPEERKNAISDKSRVGVEWDTLRAHAHNPALPEDLRVQIAAVLHSDVPPPPGFAFTLASAVRDVVDAQSPAPVRRDASYEGPPRKTPRRQTDDRREDF